MNEPIVVRSLAEFNELFPVTRHDDFIEPMAGALLRGALVGLVTALTVGIGWAVGDRLVNRGR